MAPQFIASNTPFHQDERRADFSPLQSALNAPSLGWTGLGAGLGLVWFDWLAAPPRTYPVVLTNQHEILPRQ